MSNIGVGDVTKEDLDKLKSEILQIMNGTDKEIKRVK